MRIGGFEVQAEQNVQNVDGRVQIMYMLSELFVYIPIAPLSKNYNGHDSKLQKTQKMIFNDKLLSTLQGRKVRPAVVLMKQSRETCGCRMWPRPPQKVLRLLRITFYIFTSSIQTLL